MFDGVPAALPALEQAVSYQKRAARVGFDWPSIDGVKAKLTEELQELENARDEKEREHELGDVFFAVVNLARWLKVDAESALRKSNARFRGRFGRVEAGAGPARQGAEGYDACGDGRVVGGSEAGKR